MQRRTFFKSSLTLAALLITWRQGVLVPAAKIAGRIKEFHFLEKPDILLLQKMLPIILPFYKWNVEELASFSSRLDQTIYLTTKPVKSEVRQLFDLFHIKPFLWMNGIYSLEKANKEQLESLISSMKHSRLKDLKAAGNGFCELMSSVYYADPKTYKDLSYEAPLELL